MRHRRWLRLLVVGAAIGLVAAACSSSGDGDSADGEEVELTQDGGTLQEVLDRGHLNCLVNDQLLGFGQIDDEGNFSGFDIDYCRAIAAALFDDPDAVEFTPVTAEQRFTALQSGEGDVLIRNTTDTAFRDGVEGVTFMPTTFYDGQGMMVHEGAYDSIAAMDGATICVLSGTTTELNLTTVATDLGITLTPLTFDDNDTMTPAFLEGQCDGWTTDKSGLAGLKPGLEEAGSGPLTILDETVSKEPLGPAVRDGDSEWAQAIRWITFSPVQAEEFGCTSENADTCAGDNPDILRWIGEPTEDEADFDSGLGLPADFNLRILRHLGNYGQIFDRNIGPDTPSGLPRGVNAQWTDGGLLYAPPYR